MKRERKDGVDPSFTEWNNKSERHPATLEYTPSLFNNAAGAWNVKVSGDAGTADQRIDLTQDGNKIARTFKGPRQSGTIEGTVEGNNIRFRVKAFVPIDYVGTVDGDSMKGTLTGRGKTGEWTATRVK